MQKISVLCLISLACLASAQLSIAPSSIDFGDVQVGQPIERMAYIINVGDQPVTMSGIGGGVSGVFQSTQNCQGDTISPGKSCQMYFTFNSSNTGRFSAVSQGTWNGEPFEIVLTANAVAPQLSIAPSSIDFGTVQVGESAQRVAYITNVGNAPVFMTGSGGGLNAPFQAMQNCVSKTLNPGSTCEMIFTFSPSNSGSVVGYSIGEWNNQNYNITLTGNTADIEA